jgi:Uma2 family endonuclease
MSSLVKPRLSPEEYLTIERNAERKSEFYAGEMFAMAGASEAHNLITVNVTRELSSQLRGRPCRTYAGDMRVKVSETGLYTYPDVAVACGEVQFEDTHRDTLLNPTVIVEVLSPSTEAYDRGEKFAQYLRLPSLQQYILIAQDRPRIERYRRSEEQEWIFSATDGLENTTHLGSIGCDLVLADVYDRVEFAAAEGTRRLGPLPARGQ